MSKTKQVLILIDIQNESKFGIENLDTVVRNARKLIDVCRRKNIPVIYSRQINRADTIGLSRCEEIDETGKPVFYCTGTEAVEVVDEITPQEKDIIVDKYRWSAFYQTSLDLFLKSLGSEDIIIGGLISDACLMTSVIDAYYRDYQIHLIKDMCATTCDGAHMGSILMMANWLYGIKIYDTTEMIKRLEGLPHKVWQGTKAGEFYFTPENMREVYARLDSEAHIEEPRE